jgi:hypothetical protein
VFRARQKTTVSPKRECAAAQPRPALGRRPWFALLRRARSLRRFALAIRRESVAGSWRSLTLVDHDTGWVASPVFHAARWRDRWRGIRSGHRMVLLHTNMVHGRGLRQPIRLASINDAGKVVATEVLEPGSFVWLRQGSWTLEMPLQHPSPARGAVLAIYPRPGDRQAHPLRNPDRESE